MEKKHVLKHIIIKDDDVFNKYNEIWDKSKNRLNINFTAWLFMMKNT